MRGASASVRALTAVVVVAAMALTGCSDGSDDGSDADDSGANGGQSALDGSGATTTLARTVTGAVDLRRLVVPDALAGYEELASPPFGAVDLERLLMEFSDAPADDRVILEEARYKAGYTRGWIREQPPSFLGVFVFEFADEDGARSARDAFNAQNAAGKSASRFTVAGIADSRGQSYTQEAEGEAAERVHLVTFVRGPRLYQVSGQFSGLEASPDETVAFARLQNQVAA